MRRTGRYRRATEAATSIPIAESGRGVTQLQVETTAEDVARIATDMGLLDSPPAAIEVAVLDYADNYPSDDDEDEAIPPSRLAAFREQIFRERDDIAGADARYRKLRIERGEPEFLNSDAYGPQARIMVDGVVTELAGDRKRKAELAYLGDTIENIAKGHERPEGAHSSGSGRVGTDPKLEKLKRWRRRVSFDDEPPAPKTVVISARVAICEKKALHDAKLSLSTLCARAGRAILAGATADDIIAALDELVAKKRGATLPKR